MDLVEMLRLVAAEVVLARHTGCTLMLEVEMADRNHAAMQDPEWWLRPTAVDDFLGILLSEVNVPEIVEDLIGEPGTGTIDYAQAQLDEWYKLRICDIVPQLTRCHADDTMEQD